MVTKSESREISRETSRCARVENEAQQRPSVETTGGYAAKGAGGQTSAPLLDGCGDSLYRHRSMVATKLAQNLNLEPLPFTAREWLRAHSSREERLRM